MGKGTIAGGGSGGLYSLTLDYGDATRDATVAKLTAKRVVLDADIAAKQIIFDAAQAAEDAQKPIVTAAIDAYIAARAAETAALAAVTQAKEDLAALQADEFATPEAIAAAQATLTAANATYAAAKAAVPPALTAYTAAAAKLHALKGKTTALRIPLDLLKAQSVQMGKDIAAWSAVVLTETIPAWCADLTEDASGEVATIEIPGENALVLISPAAPAFNPANGLMTAREIQSPAQVFWNAAVLPGWQKWKPTYRKGIITAVDTSANTANVALDAAYSSAKGLAINQQANLTAVPVEYMSCHAVVFEVGDACVVRFNGQDQTTPTVVGFVSNPKPCASARYCSNSGLAYIFTLATGVWARISGSETALTVDWRYEDSAWQPLTFNPTAGPTVMYDAGAGTAQVDPFVFVYDTVNTDNWGPDGGILQNCIVIQPAGVAGLDGEGGTVFTGVTEYRVKDPLGATVFQAKVTFDAGFYGGGPGYVGGVGIDWVGVGNQILPL